MGNLHQIGDKFPTIWRNLALAYFNKKDEKTKAMEYMERAFQLNPTDARILMELDQLYKRMCRPHAERLAFLQQYPELIMQRDDLVLEEITLLNQIGEYEKAKELLDGHIFHPWEGGEGKVSAQYQFARVELAKQALVTGKHEAAIDCWKNVWSIHVIWVKVNCTVLRRMIFITLWDVLMKL